MRVFTSRSGSGDDLLAEGEAMLNDGAEQKLVLRGAGSFHDLTISFRYDLSSIIAPAAILELSEIKASGLPSTKAKPGSKKKGANADPYLRFRLLEVGDVDETVVTPAMPNTTKADWGQLVLQLHLPRGSARPPLLAIGLWDDDVKNDDDALAFEDTRLSQTGGVHSVKLVGRKGARCKNVTVTFAATIS